MIINITYELGFRSCLDCYVVITIPNPSCNDFRKLRVTNVTPLMVHKHQEQEDEEEKRRRNSKTRRNPKDSVPHVFGAQGVLK